VTIIDGGAMTADELPDGDHSITGVKVVQDGNDVIVRCPCGWSSGRYSSTRHATAEWQTHRAAAGR
jgi:hypothetical protein